MKDEKLNQNEIDTFRSSGNLTEAIREGIKRKLECMKVSCAELSRELEVCPLTVHKWLNCEVGRCSSYRRQQLADFLEGKFDDSLLHTPEKILSRTSVLYNFPMSQEAFECLENIAACYDVAVVDEESRRKFLNGVHALVLSAFEALYDRYQKKLIDDDEQGFLPDAKLPSRLDNSPVPLQNIEIPSPEDPRIVTEICCDYNTRPITIKYLKKFKCNYLQEIANETIDGAENANLKDKKK